MWVYSLTVFLLVLQRLQLRLQLVEVAHVEELVLIFLAVNSEVVLFVVVICKR